MTGLRLPVRVYSVAVVTAGAAGLLLTRDSALATPSTLTLLVVLLAAATLARLWPVHLSAKIKVTVEDTATFAAALVLGPFLAMCVAGGSALLALRVSMRGPWIQHLFNASANALAAGAAGAAFTALAGTGGDVLANPGAALAAGALKYVLDTLLVDVAVGLQLRRNPVLTWWPVHRRDIAQSIALHVLGALAAVYAMAQPWVVALFVVPTGAILLTLRETARLRERTRNGILELADLVDRRDPYTHGHSERTAVVAERLARRMRWQPSQVELVRIAARVHDIGKLGTDDHVLLKTGLLDDGERAEMHRHSELGARLLSQLPEFWEGASLVLAHHERPDGKGYPRGLASAELPLEAAVIAVADAYDAMTNDRPYRHALPWNEVRAEFLRHRGTQWHESVVDAFIDMIEEERRTGEAPAALVAATTA